LALQKLPPFVASKCDLKWISRFVARFATPVFRRRIAAEPTLSGPLKALTCLIFKSR